MGCLFSLFKGIFGLAVFVVIVVLLATLLIFRGAKHCEDHPTARGCARHSTR